MTCLFWLLYGKNVTYITFRTVKHSYMNCNKFLIKFYTENNMGGVLA